MASNSILVIGGGFAGLTAALEAAEIGHEVFIIELPGTRLRGEEEQDASPS